MSVATHEIGHAIGLDHIRGPGHERDVMYPAWIAQFDSRGNYVSHRLTANDIKAAQDIYGVPAFVSVHSFKGARGNTGGGGSGGGGGSTPRCPKDFWYFAGTNKCYIVRIS